MWSIPEAFKIIEEVNHPRPKFSTTSITRRFPGKPDSNLEKHIDKAGLFHIADVPGRHQPGTGEINYINIYKKLGELNYHGYVAMEFFPPATPSRYLLQRARKPCKPRSRNAPPDRQRPGNLLIL